MGLPTSRHLNIWMVHFIETIKTMKIPIDWALILSENLDEQLVEIKNNHKFYMTSYLLYLLVVRAMDYPRLFKKGIMQDANACPYIVYPQLMKKKVPKNIKEYMIVNDAFIIWFIKGDYEKIMSNDVVTKILEFDTYYIQFRTFTYLRVVGMTVNSKKLPRYLGDRLILLEIS